MSNRCITYAHFQRHFNCCYRVHRHAHFQVSVMPWLQLPEGETPHDRVVVVIYIVIAISARSWCKESESVESHQFCSDATTERRAASDWLIVQMTESRSLLSLFARIGSVRSRPTTAQKMRWFWLVSTPDQSYSYRWETSIETHNT
jgi:hypothetical protein